VLDNLDEVIASVSGDGAFRFNQRQLLYALRPIVKNEIGKELQVVNFNTIISDYENEHGEIPLMYREPRGSIYHPHRDETITLGTLMVEEYARPVWTFNKLVYIEKEGFAEALKAVRWGERHDCAVLSSKGFSTRAAKDLIDKLAEHDEVIKVFCVHDADAPGSMIYETLQEATRARGARKIEIVNLGLEPWEAVAMGLAVEDVEKTDRRRPVAEYVRERRGRAPGGGSWEEWFQTHRVELNAMTTPQFITWLDGKMAEHGNGKLVPPPDVLTTELDERIEDKVRAAVRERILREAGFEDQVATEVAAIRRPSATVLAKGVRQSFKQEPDREWRDHIEEVAVTLVPSTGRTDAETE
jgi:Topoisomerase 6 subunit A/Spo11, Toprim domain